MANNNLQTPHLVDTEWSKQLIVKGKPFLIRGGELQNSSLTSAEYMNTVWQQMVDTNVNTLLGCVTWEDIEPEEDRFDFAELDSVVEGARKHGLHLILLWFGSFKNGLSTYTPGWVKTNARRFPRAKLRKAGGRLCTADVVSIFHPEVRRADARAFGTLMSHLKAFDEAHSTVIMVQVENETGLLGDSRDGSDVANEAFGKAVPQDLVQHLVSDWDNLHADMKTMNLSHFDPKSVPEYGNWETIFGTSPRTDELFMAYHYAKYLNDVAAAGKAEYDIPLYTNVWLNYAGEDSDNDFPIVVGGGGSPGDYPSGGACSNVLDIWVKFAPRLDFIAPDVYLTDYASSCEKYRHRNQPLFIPEQRRDDYGARRIWAAYGTFAAMGVSPFGIDTLEPGTNPFTKHFGLLKSTSAIVLDAQRRRDTSVGFFFDEIPSAPNAKDTSPLVRRTWGGFHITIERAFVFGKPGPGAGMVIHRGGGKFLLIGWGFQVSAKAGAEDSVFTGILRFEEKKIVNEATGQLKTARVLNGDETRSGQVALMPNEDPDYGGFPICVTIPARTMIAEVQFYSLTE
ncbi:hypothetical protein HYQ44_001229 [Verticillium longisporum]|nr:hypothetical protein HYQ44_001229 [Verticillium longisporum]